MSETSNTLYLSFLEAIEDKIYNRTGDRKAGIAGVDTAARYCLALHHKEVATTNAVHMATEKEYIAGLILIDQLRKEIEQLKAAPLAFTEWYSVGLRDYSAGNEPEQWEGYGPNDFAKLYDIFKSLPAPKQS
jgi:hypothetical protein